jgi:adenylate cyclase
MSHRFFKKKLSPSQVDLFAKHIDQSALTLDIELGKKEEHECAVTFFDLFNFTNISWTISTSQTLKILQELFEYVAESVVRHRGMIDKYPGDGVVAFFPRLYSDNSYLIAESALDCVTEVMNWFYEHMRWRYDLPKPSHFLDLTAGVDAGTISIAHVGSKLHSELILLGDQVNSASKCQQVAEKKEVIVGEEARKKLSTLYTSRLSTGPRTDVIAKPNASYPCYRFDWENFAAIATWIEK